MRKTEEIEQDITHWFKKQDLGLSIIKVNDLLLELKQSRIYHAKKEVFDDIEENMPHWADTVNYDELKKRHLSSSNEETKEVIKKKYYKKWVAVDDVLKELDLSNCRCDEEVVCIVADFKKALTTIPKDMKED